MSVFAGWKAKRLAAALRPETAPEIAAEFEALGDAGIEALLGALRAKSPAVREGAARMLGQFARPDTLVPLAALACEGFAEARAALVAIGGKLARPRLVKSVRGAASEAGPALAAMLGGHKEAGEALIAMGAEGTEAAALAFEIEELAEATEGVLARMGAAGPAALTRMLVHPRKEVRRRAVRALEASGWRPSDAREEAAAAIARADWKRCAELEGVAVEPLIACLSDGDAEIRLNAVRTLGALKDRRAVAGLVGALEDRKDTVRREAVEALGRIGGAEAAGALAARLRSSYDLREAALAALEKIGWQPTSLPDRALMAVLSQDRAAVNEAAVAELLLRSARTLDFGEVPEDVVMRGLELVEDARAKGELERRRRA